MYFFYRALFFLFVSLFPFKGFSERHLNTYDKIPDIRCRDIMTYVSIYPMPQDPDVNVMFLTCLYHCYSKLILAYKEKYAKPEEKPILRQQIHVLNSQLKPLLHALKMAFVVFGDPINFRYTLNQEINKIIEKKEENLESF